jgi:hypothetical protein
MARETSVCMLLKLSMLTECLVRKDRDELVVVENEKAPNGRRLGEFRTNRYNSIVGELSSRDGSQFLQVRTAG